MHYTFILVIMLLSSCASLTPQEAAHYSSRIYPEPLPAIFEAVKQRVEAYPMGLAGADAARGLVVSRTGTATPGVALAGASVGYQISVRLAADGNGTRVTPAWRMNISSEPTKAQFLDVPIDHNPMLYIEFFDELDRQLTRP